MAAKLIFRITTSQTLRGSHVCSKITKANMYNRYVSVVSLCLTGRRHQTPLSGQVDTPATV